MYTVNNLLAICEKPCRSDEHYSGGNNETIASIFLTIAAAKGNAQAIVQMDEKLDMPSVITYSQLHNQVQILAHRLIVDYEVKVGDVVCQCMERSFDMVIGLLAIFVAGGVYCPLNPTDPEERISTLIESTNARLVILHSSTEDLVQHINKPIKKLIFNYKDDSSKENQTKYASMVHSRAIPSDIAYIIFTSGSTGKPKGVPISHVNFLTHWRSIHQSLSDDKPLRSNDDITLSMGSATFDISLNEILSSLLLGSHFIMLQPRGHLDAGHIVDTIESQNITQLFAVPSALRPLLDFVERQQCSQRLASLRSVWCGGEPVLGQLASQFYRTLSSSSIEFVNVYGPTECTILSTYHRVTKADIDRDVLPIGRPLPHYSCCILDENFVSVQQGSVGELCVGGEAVFGGYLTNGNNEDVARLNSLNVRILIDIPFLQSSSNKNDHNKFYRTGDLCRLNDNGEIVFVGRVDHQVKLRGQRLELGEIEACISTISHVTYCVAVKCCDQANQHEFLAAYVQCPASTPISLSIKEAIQHRCRNHLPAYMVPTVVVLMDKLPLNTNGKVDRNQLPVPQMNTQFDLKSTEYKEPSSELERTIHEQWVSILGIDQISMYANFFSLGGNSLLLMRLFGNYRASGLIKSKTISIDPFFAQAMLIEHVRLLEQENVLWTNVDEIKMADDNIWLPLGVEKAVASAAQQRIWLDEQLRFAKSSKTAMYNVVIPIIVRNSNDANKSCIELSRLRRALLAVIRRHKVLRTCIQLELNVITQYVNPIPDQCPLEQHERFYSFVESVCSNNDHVQQILTDEVLNHVFRINEGLIVRFHLIRRSIEHIGRDLLTSGDVLVFNIHHAAIDGESKALFMSDLQRAYDNEHIFGKQGGEDLFQYIDFSIHESRFFEANTDSSLLAEARDYWQRSLDGCLDKHLSLCQRAPRMDIEDVHGNYLFELETDLVTDFVSLAAVQNLSLYQMYLAAYVLFLYKMTGDRDICVGGVTANRYRSEQEDLIGMFVNLLPYRIKFDNIDDDLRVYYGHVRQVCLDFMRYGLLPLQEIVRLHRTSHNQLHVSPFFQTTLAFYSNTAASHLGTYSFDGVPCESISPPISVVKFDLCLVINHTLTEDDKGINGGRGRHRMLCKWEYSPRLYDVDEIQILATRFTSFLASLIDAEKMTQLSVLIPNDFKVFRQLNNTPTDLSHSTIEPSIITHFEMHVRNQPDKIVLICNGVQFTYEQINKQANQLAAHLIESCGVRPGDVIMQCVNRGIEMVAGILAILKAQAIYCPLNPADPSHRHISLINDINASVVLCDRTTAHIELKRNCLMLVNVTEVLHSITPTMRITLQRQQSIAKTDDVAYIIYTSGSTGKPKAVPITHGNFLTCIHAMQQLKMIDSSDIVAQITECTYDVHLMELLGCLVSGGTLVMLKKHGNMDMSYLANTIKNYNVTWAILVPTLALSLYEQLSTSAEYHDKLLSLKTWISGGEPMVPSTIEKLLPYFSSNIQIYNVYGPAEASMAATVYRVQPKDFNAKFIPIGRALPNYSCHILDKDLSPVPVGFVGELFIGGPAVFGGYRGGGDDDNDRLKSLNNTTLVNIAAFQYQSNGNGHNKFYRTGDLCRFNDDGEIVFVGRVDHQVKLRGQRLELGEIEACIRTANPEIEVRNCIVVKCVDELTHQEYLTAYVEPAYGTLAENYNTIKASIMKACMQRLPVHMVPSSWLLLESLPLNANNKIDRKQLPLVPLKTNKIRRKCIRQVSIDCNGYVEDVLSEIFSNALNVDVDSGQHHMSFIELGGSSLNAITMVNLIRERLYAEMQIDLLFKNPTILALANVLQPEVIKLFTSCDNNSKFENDTIANLIEQL